MPFNPAHLTARFRCALKSEGLPARFGVVTAYNPGDQIQSPELNARGDEALEARLRTGGRVYFRVTGGAPDFAHAEPGWGVGAVECAEVVGLGREFHQAAVYWVESDHLWLVSCADEERAYLGSWRERTEFR